MKRIIGLSFLGLLIVALSVPVYAQTLEFKASGMVDTNWMHYRNIMNLSGSGDPGIGVPGAIYGPPTAQQVPSGAIFNKETNWYNTRGLLKFDAAMGKEVSMTTFFEMDATRWGENGTGRNNAGDWQTDAIAVELKHLYLDLAIPYVGIPVPMTARIGIQPLAVRNELVTSNDGTGITLGFKLDPVTISPFYFKALQSGTANGRRLYDYSDDNNVFGVQGTAAIGTLTVGAYGVFYDLRTYPFTSTTSTYGLSPSYKANLYWFGGYADGKLGPVNIKADLVMDYGKVKSQQVNAGPDVKYKGYAGRLAIRYPWEKFEFGIVGAYGSGSDTQQTAGNGLNSTTDGGNLTSDGSQSHKVGSYVIPPGSEEPPAFGGGGNGIAIFYQSPILGRQPDFSTDGRFQATRGALGGTWTVKGQVAYKLTPWYKITLLGSYIGDTTKHGNTVGSAVTSNGRLRDDNTIGWEFGLYNELQIYKNVYFGVVGSYLYAQDGLDYFDSTRNLNVKARDPYIIGSIIKYTW